LRHTGGNQKAVPIAIKLAVVVHCADIVMHTIFTSCGGYEARRDLAHLVLLILGAMLASHKPRVAGALIIALGLVVGGSSLLDVLPLAPEGLVRVVGVALEVIGGVSLLTRRAVAVP
jgi:hypothetical protein